MSKDRLETKDLAVIDNETGETLALVSELKVDNSLLVNIGYVVIQKSLTQQNFSRVSWNKASGVWQHELYTDEVMADMTANIMGAVALWARWSDKVGQPQCAHVGDCRECLLPQEEHEPGIRLYFNNDAWGECYADFFGTLHRVAQGCIKLAMRGQPQINFVGRKEINTRYGKLSLPVIQRNSSANA